MNLENRLPDGGWGGGGGGVMLTACSKRARRASSAAIIAALSGSTDACTAREEGSEAAESNGIADCTPIHALPLGVLATAARALLAGISLIDPPEPGGGSMTGLGSE